jgi:putative DNA primase/helicase
MPSGMFPIAYATGSPDSGKSSLTRLTKSLIDPSPLSISTGIPSSEEILKVAEGGGFLLCCNNISKITNDESDILSCLVEGASRLERRLHTNKDLVAVNTRAPIFLNGVGLAAERSDILSRLIQLNLETPTERMGETEYDKQCEAVRPLVLGALYDVVSVALRNRSTVEIEDPPRLVDVTKWLVASEPALGVPEGTILAAMQTVREEGINWANETSPLPRVLKHFVREKGGDRWATTNEWLAELNAFVDRTRQSNVRIGGGGWPKTAQQLGQAFSYLRAGLRAEGLFAANERTRQKKGWRVRLLDLDTVSNEGEA